MTENTIYGELNGIVSSERYKSGTLKSCIFKAENILHTPHGDLVPQYSAAGYGERQKKYRSAVAFYENGVIKSIALENQTMISTSLGVFPAELVTFYEDGSLKRIFPLNGKIDGFWTEEREGELAEKYLFQFPFGHFEAKIIGLQFYPSGAVKSLTLWPGEKIEIETPLKKMTVRNGFSLYEDGSLKSVEPAGPTSIETVIGELMAYDKDALGIHGDTNSLNFSRNGQLKSLVSTHTGVRVIEPTGKETDIAPKEVISIIDETELTVVPIEVRFERDLVILSDHEKEHEFPMEGARFTIFRPKMNSSRSCTNCSSCSGC